MPNAAEIQTQLLKDLYARAKERGLGVRKWLKSIGVGTSTYYNYKNLETSPSIYDLCRLAESLQSRLDARIVPEHSAGRKPEESMKLKTIAAREVALAVDMMSPADQQYVVSMVRDLRRHPSSPVGQKGARRAGRR